MTLIKSYGYNASLLAVLVANALAFVAVTFGDGYLPNGWTEAISRWRSMWPAGIGLVLVGVLNSQISPDWKARLIFWRYQNPLPGSRAFTELGPADARVDMRKISTKYGPLPTDPFEQNKAWYGLYKTVKNEEPIVGIHRDYLFFRDYGVASVAMLIILSTTGFFLADHWQPILAYTIALLMQAALTIRAARDRGYRFVTTVLAAVTI